MYISSLLVEAFRNIHTGPNLLLMLVIGLHVAEFPKFDIR